MSSVIGKPWRPVEPQEDSPAITLTKYDDRLEMRQGDNVITFKGMQTAYLISSMFEAGRYDNIDEAEKAL